jgi:hypothetical protein
MALKTRKNTKKENKKGCGSKSCKHYKHNYKNGKCNTCGKYKITKGGCGCQMGGLVLGGKRKECVKCNTCNKCKSNCKCKKQQTGGNLGFVDNISNIGSNFFESVVNVVNTAVYANPPVVPSSPLLGHFSKL